MALIVEDGSGSNPLAESYISVANALTYHAARGNSAWATLSTAQQEQALRRATDYIEQVYGRRWNGHIKSVAQPLSWPRNYVTRADVGYGWSYYPNDSVPLQVQNACAELALKAAAGELAPDLERTVIREKLDTLDVEYDKNGPQYVRYRAIDNLLAIFLNGMGGANTPLVRA